MSQKAVRFTTRCPECREPAQLPGEDLLTNPHVPVLCARCGTTFNASLVPGDARPAPPPPLERARKASAGPAPQPEPRRLRPEVADPLPFPDLIPVREEASAAEAAVPFAPIGSARPQASAPMRKAPAPGGAPFVPAGGTPSGKGGFNSLLPWKQYTILGLLLVIVAVGVFLAPIGEGGKAEEEDDRPAAGEVDTPRPKKPAKTEEPIELDLDVPKNVNRPKPEDMVPKVPIKGGEGGK